MDKNLLLRGGAGLQTTANDNGKWGGDWAKYRAAHPKNEDCSVSEDDNWKGAGQCSQSWECRGARLCDRGGWCYGYDGCSGDDAGVDQASGALLQLHR